MLELLAGGDAVRTKVNEAIEPRTPTRRRAPRRRAWAPSLRPFAFVLDLGLRSREGRHDVEPCRPCPDTAAR